MSGLLINEETSKKKEQYISLFEEVHGQTPNHLPENYGAADWELLIEELEMQRVCNKGSD